MIGRVFAERGYIEQWGSGIRRMAEACRGAGLALPVIEERPGRVRVTFSMTASNEPTLTARERQAFDMTNSGAGISPAELAIALKVSDRTARTVLAGLVSKRVAVVIGSSPNDPQRRFFRRSPSSPARAARQRDRPSHFQLTGRTRQPATRRTR